MRRFDSDVEETRHAKFSVEIGSDDKAILYTNLGISRIVYTKNITDVNRWDSLLFETCATRLAWYLTGPIVRDHNLIKVKMDELQVAFDEAVGVNEAEGGINEYYSRDLVTVRW
jgi:hypothetical protein